jgi:hypothetical protein
MMMVLVGDAVAVLEKCWNFMFVIRIAPGRRSLLITDPNVISNGDVV